MTFKMSEEAQTIIVYNLRSDTNEFIGSGDAYIPPHTGLPANSTSIAPPEDVIGKVSVFDSEKQAWSQIEDHRGETVFNTESTLPLYINELGPLPSGTTSIAPEGVYQKWDGEKWIKDEKAEKAAQVQENESKKNDLMQQVNTQILPLQDAVDLDMATEEEKAQLLSLKKYRVLLGRVDVNDPVWPSVE
jgi:Caudovirales tail fibre assembly protein.